MMKQKLKKQGTISGIVLILFMLLSSFSANLQAQELITGKVVDVSGVAVPGVNVSQKGAVKGTVTDLDGNFSLQLVAGQKKLIFSSIGYEMQEISTAGKTVLKVILRDNVKSLDEVVVIGYSTVKRQNILGSVSGVKAESIEKATPVSALEGIQGKVAGVRIATNGGPGGTFDIQIRGLSTFESGVNPLYVVDGQQLEDIDNLNPDDIETMEVIKDGATAAIYGSKAANGVILITTKKGKKGELKVDVTSISGFNSLVGDVRVANSRQRQRYDILKAPNGIPTNTIEADTMSLMRANSFDLQKLVTRTGIRQQTNVSVSGANDRANYYWNTSVTDEQGIVLNSKFKRLTSMLKLDLNISEKFTIGSKINLTYDEQKGINEDQVLQQIVERIPYYPVFEPDGSYSQEFGGRANPLAETTATNVSRNYRAQVFSYAQYEILPKLKIKSTLGINYRFNKNVVFNPIITVNPTTPIPTGRERYNNSYDIQQENFLNYRNTFGNHSFAMFAGMQIQDYRRENFDIGANFLNDYVQTFNNYDPLIFTINSSTMNSENANFSTFAGFNYDFKGKYLVSGTYRRDGSSRFGANNKYGNFPSGSIGWKVNKESFFKVKSISNLMLKASFGVVGNERIADYDFTGPYEIGSTYNGLGGIAPKRLGNDELRWEKTTSTNIGLDLGMFNNRLTFNFDVWRKVTTDLLASVPLPEESGFSSIRKNVGSVNNEGFDLDISGTIIKKKNFTWNSSFNISFQRNEVTKLDGGTPFEVGQYRIEEGQSIGNIFGYKNLGVYQYNESNAYTNDGVRLTPNFDANGAFVNYTLNGVVYTDLVRKMRTPNTVMQGGDIIWEDLNGDFTITAADRQIIGNGLPKYFGGFTNDFKYKGFSLSFLFDYNLGQDIYRRWDELRNDLNSNGETPGPDRIEGAWVKPGDVTVYPRLIRTNVPQNQFTPNSFFVTKGDYIKLRYIKVEYNFSKDVLNKLNFIKRMSLNLAVNNVLTWTNYIGYNPELGNRGNALTPGLDNLRYPNDREIILGLKIQL